MHLTSASVKERPKACATILPFWHGKKEAEAAFSSKELTAHIQMVLESKDFSGKEGEVYYLLLPKSAEKRLVLVGLGDEKKVSVEGLRRSYAHAVRYLHKVKAEDANFLFPETKTLRHDLVCRGVCEGIFLSNYSFDALKGESKKESPPHLKKICFLGVKKEDLALSHKYETICSCVYRARDLVMGNADDVTPTLLASKAKELAKDFQTIKTTIFDRKQIEKEKMGLLAAVAKGAKTEPAFVLMEYRGAPHSKELTALVGKGITFDTGGLNLKPTGSIENMRDDMSGAAAVLGTLRVAASLKLKINILGVIASTENAIGPESYKPGDVHVSRSGITVEIANTDAEGRLVLADALTYIQDKYDLTRVVDLATLTGSIVVALGEETSGLFSNNDKLADELIDAGEATYERVWRMPLFSEYKEQIKSKVADIKNAGGRAGGSITAALFLERFIRKDLPWAHLDIAGTAFTTELKPYQPTSASGVGVRLLVEFLEKLIK